MRKKIWLALIICAVLASIIKNRSYAADAAFDTTYNIEYSVDNSLVVSVKEDISVINQSASAVPSSFIETITNISIYDIKVLDSKSKEIAPEVVEKEKEAVIKIPIEDPAIGKDKRTQITLLYKTNDLAQKTGRILNLNIPKAPVSNFIQEYNVQIKIPKDFGPQISITPKPVQEKMEEEGYTLLYNKQTLKDYGISASFGDYQIFNFDLGYKIKNDSIFTERSEITLPLPIKDYQEISITDIEPAPLTLKKDADGNILAVFKVPGKTVLDVTAKGKAKVYTKKINPDANGSLNNIPAELKRYLTPQKFWESGDKGVKELAGSITDKQKSVNANALSIYTYLTSNILYDFNNAKEGKTLPRKGAVQTLIDKKGLCLDFTDTFIALARASGIPAREVNGYAYTKDPTTSTPVDGSGNFLHSWAQFFSPQYGWVSVDPTWGATSGLDYFSKLDNNHLAFVIKGLDSQSPQPAQEIKVEFSGDDFFNKDSKYDLDNLKEENWFNINPFLPAAFFVGLALCTTFVLLRVRSKARHK